jgi:hypothetical protein
VAVDTADHVSVNGVAAVLEIVPTSGGGVGGGVVARGRPCASTHPTERTRAIVRAVNAKRNAVIL